MKYRSNAAQLINANFLASKQNESPVSGLYETAPHSVLEYAEMQIEADPSFYRWFFEDDSIGDFGVGATTEQEKILFEFLHESL